MSSTFLILLPYHINSIIPSLLLFPRSKILSLCRSLGLSIYVMYFIKFFWKFLANRLKLFFAQNHYWMPKFCPKFFCPKSVYVMYFVKIFWKFWLIVWIYFLFLPKIITEHQSAFTKNRFISDNILVAFKSLHSIQRHIGKEGYMVIKLDMSKVFDRVEWAFLQLVMKKRGSLNTGSVSWCYVSRRWPIQS